MAKKRKESNGGKGEEQQPPPRNDDNGGADSSSDESSSDDDSLVLEGAVMRNPDVSDSSDDDDDLSSEEEEAEAGQAKKKAKTNAKGGGKAKSTQQKKKKKSPSGPETIQVEFLFCDVHERFFHGLKTLLHRHPIHASHSSQLADLVIANEMVATVLSSDIDPTADAAAAGQKKQGNQSSKGAVAAVSPPQEEANVFGFASIVNISANNASPTIQSLTSLCLKHCPQQHKAEMETVLSGKTKRPAGFFFHERMVNVPLEITEVLHQQLVLDMDFAVEHADDEAERKSLDFGAFVRLAPCYKGEGGGNNSVMYKYFDDEVFATNAEFVYTFDAPKMYEGDEEDMLCSVIVITKTGHRKAMGELKKMIHVG